MVPDYKKPILTAIYTINGLFILIVGVMGAFYFGSEQGFAFGVVFSLVAVVASLMSFGIAQCVDFLARTAHNTELLVWYQNNAQAIPPARPTPSATYGKGALINPSAMSDDPDIQDYLALKAKRGE